LSWAIHLRPFGLMFARLFFHAAAFGSALRCSVEIHLA